MKFNPNNFYIGIIDLFAILLPGAIATLVINFFYAQEITQLLSFSSSYSGFYEAFLFLLSSYFLGHVISQLGSYLDDLIYDPLKDRIFRNHKRLELVKNIREESYGNNLKDDYLNTFKWAKFKLLSEFPESIQEIERYMADSKFFRGLIVIFIIVLIVLMMYEHWLSAVVCLILIAFSFVRYFFKRHLATETAYKYIIFLEKLNEKIITTDQ